MAGSVGAQNRSEPDLLGIYLNDHLAIETGMVELARRTARAHQDLDIGAALAELAAEIAEDRDALRQMMAVLGVPVRYYKVCAAWVAEKAGRLKLNGHVRGRSPLSIVVELEGLRLGAAGKASAWRALREVANHDNRLDVARLDGLLSRARHQTERLEELHVRMTSEIFSARVPSA